MNILIKPGPVGIFGLFVLIIALSLSGSQTVLGAWQEPTAAPPGNNRPEPLDTSGTAQTKAGGLTIQGAAILSGGATASAISVTSVNEAISGVSTGNQGATDFAIHGTALNGGWAGYFQGPVLITQGSLQVGTGASQLCLNSQLAEDCVSSWAEVGGNQTLLEVLQTDANAGAFAGPTSIGGSVTFGGDLTVSGGGVTGSNSEAISLGETNDVISFTSGGAEKMRIHSNGYIGIGTTGPSGKLDIQAGALAAPPLQVQRSYDGGRIRFQYAATTNGYGEIGQTYNAAGKTVIWIGANLNTFGAAHQPPTQGDGGGASWYTMFNTISDYFAVNRIAAGGGASASSLLYINSSGNVGIGTTSPTKKFHLADGSIRVTNGTDNIDITTVNASNYSEIRWGDDLNSDRLRFYFDDWMDVGDKEVMSLLSNGNVGINSSSPGYKLDVQGGQINASGGLCINGDCRASWGQVAGLWTDAGTYIYPNNATGVAITDSNTLSVCNGICGMVFVPYTSTVGNFSNSLASGVAVYGYTGGDNSAAVLGYADGLNSYAGYFSGNLNVTNMSTFGTADLAVGSGQNLLYGNIDNISVGNLMLLQTESADRFKVEADGDVITAGNFSAASTGYSGIRLNVKNSSGAYATIRAENENANGLAALFLGKVLGNFAAANGTDCTNGQILKKNASNSWTCSVDFGGTPGGSNTHVQYNNSDAFGGDSGFIYDSASDRATLGALTVDTNTLYIDSSNDRVGIGTASPGYKLAVSGTIKAGTGDPGTQFLADGINGDLSIIDGSRIETTRNTLYIDYSVAKNFSVNNGQLYVTSSGYVGIGTTNPGTYKLNVQGDVRISNQLKVYGTSDNIFQGMTSFGVSNPKQTGMTVQDLSANTQNIIYGAADVESLAQDAGLILLEECDDDPTNCSQRFKVDLNGNTTVAGYLKLNGNEIRSSLSDTPAIEFENGNIIFEGSISDSNSNVIINDGLEVANMSIFGSAALVIDSGENLFYGNINSSSQGNLLLLQQNSSDIFKVNNNGQTSIYSSISPSLYILNDNNSDGDYAVQVYSQGASKATISSSGKISGQSAEITNNLDVNGSVLMGWERRSLTVAARASTYTCTAGKKVIGGGVFCYTSAGYSYVERSYPSADDTWSGLCSESPGTEQIGIFIICARIGD